MMFWIGVAAGVIVVLAIIVCAWAMTVRQMFW